jgi:hypothetical protein
VDYRCPASRRAPDRSDRLERKAGLVLIVDIAHLRGASTFSRDGDVALGPVSVLVSRILGNAEPRLENPDREPCPRDHAVRKQHGTFARFFESKLILQGSTVGSQCLAREIHR